MHNTSGSPARTICMRLLMLCWIYFNLKLWRQHFQYLHVYEFILYQVINGYFQVDLVIFTPWKEVIRGKEKEARNILYSAGTLLNTIYMYVVRGFRKRANALNARNQLIHILWSFSILRADMIEKKLDYIIDALSNREE